MPRAQPLDSARADHHRPFRHVFHQTFEDSTADSLQ
jgi:hypothetical protein